MSRLEVEIAGFGLTWSVQDRNFKIFAHHGTALKKRSAHRIRQRCHVLLTYGLH